LNVEELDRILWRTRLEEATDLSYDRLRKDAKHYVILFSIWAS